MSSPFIYDEDIPGVVLPEIKRALEPWEWMVPGWCQRVFVGYSDDSDSASDGTIADCAVEYPYRWARITFKPKFLTQNNVPADGLHEILHISVAVLASWARETIKTLVPDNEHPKFRETLLAELQDRIESVTEDIAWRISERAKTESVAIRRDSGP